MVLGKLKIWWIKAHQVGNSGGGRCCWQSASDNRVSVWVHQGETDGRKQILVFGLLQRLHLFVPSLCHFTDDLLHICGLSEAKHSSYGEFPRSVFYFWLRVAYRLWSNLAIRGPKKFISGRVSQNFSKRENPENLQNARTCRLLQRYFARVLGNLHSKRVFDGPHVVLPKIDHLEWV